MRPLRAAAAQVLQYKIKSYGSGSVRNYLIPVSLFLIVLATASCGRRENAAVKEQERKTSAEAGLMASTIKALPTLVKRLKDQIKPKDRMLVLRPSDEFSIGLNLFNEIQVVPDSTPWAVTCGQNGLWLKFGYGSGDDDDNMTIQLTDTSLSTLQCQTYAPFVGSKISTLQNGGHFD
jgi:hypothetical protein